MNLRPTQDRVIILVDQTETTTAGGLIIPETAKEKARTGVVVAVGPGRPDKNGVVHEPDVEVGDRVAFPKYVGATEEEHKELNMGDREHRIVRESDLLAILEG
jgi:chaperonin GroES